MKAQDTDHFLALVLVTGESYEESEFLVYSFVGIHSQKEQKDDLVANPCRAQSFVGTRLLI